MNSNRTSSLSTSTSLHNDQEYETDDTSMGSDTGNESKSRSDLLSDDGISENASSRPLEFYRAHASEVNNMNIANIYADSTILQLESVESHWRQYCKTMGYDPVEKMQNISVGDVSSFFMWKLDQKQGTDERRLRGIKSASSLATYRKMFLRVYKRLTRIDMDSEMSRKTLIVTVSLAQRYNLSHQPKEKPSMDVKDMLEIIQTTLTTTEKMFQMGRYRIQTCFFMQGGFITANRPQALLGLRYRDVKVTVLRNPNDGPHNILIELTYNFTKSYLGPKPSNTFVIPEIIFDPSLCMSPHVFLLGLMFADDVFSIPDLTPEGLFKLRIRSGCNQLVVPIKDEVADLWIFRRYEKTATKRIISQKQLPYSTIKAHMKDVGEISGFKDVTRPYCLRYGSGNAFDKNGDTSENMRNMIMNHSNSKVFLNHYASRNIKLDAQAVVRGTKPQEELIQAACRMSRSIDPYRPRSLTEEQTRSVDRDSEICKLLKKRKGLDKVSQEYKELQRKIRNERQQKRYALKKRIREEYDKKQAEEDIRRQLSGRELEKKIKTNLRQCSERTKEHKKLIASIMSLPGPSLQKEIQRRIEAISAIAGYCHYEEGEMSKTRRRSPSVNHEPQEVIDMDENAVEDAKEVFKKEERPTICFICVGNQALNRERRFYKFSSPGDLSKHFKRHLDHFDKIRGEECALCKEHLLDPRHMQRHAFERHGTVSNNWK